LLLLSLSLKATSDMKLVPALVIAIIIDTVAAGIVSSSSSNARISDRNIGSISPKVTGLESEKLRPALAFWDDDHAGEEDWNKNAAKGGALMCGLEGSDQVAGRQMKDTRQPPSAASHYNDDLRADLHNWYWRETNPSSFSCSFSKHWHLPYAMQGEITNVIESNTGIQKAGTLRATRFRRSISGTTFPVTASNTG
jgi:hypothetical protein